MFNCERQRILDKKKWIVSEDKKEDMSGKMNYCAYCYYRDLFEEYCTATQEERESQCLCATAYNRMGRICKK